MQQADFILRVCNACRYCEGYCAVFPAMERRQSFGAADMKYLANLCHNCGECLDACQYAPPHEFGVDLPKLMEQLRNDSWRQYTWPRAIPNWILIAAGVVVPALLARRGATFYRVIPYPVMVGLFGIVALLVVAICAAGVARSGETFKVRSDALTLRYLGGSRRWFHHFTFYGFALCFASTCTAAFYQEVLRAMPPYPYFSLPVLLGSTGGLALVFGTLGLISMNYRSSFTVLLLLTASSGLALLALRQTAAMNVLLVVHLGIVLALFLTLPYGKFVHAIYRSAALVRYAAERAARR